MWSWVLSQAQKTQERERENGVGLEEKKVKTFLQAGFLVTFFADKMFLYILTNYLLNFIKKIKIVTEKAKCISSPLVKEYLFPHL